MKRLAVLFVTVAVLLLLAGCDTEETGIVYDSDDARDEDDAHGEDEERQYCPTFSGVDFGSIRETWQCFDTLDRNQAKVLVTLTRLGGDSDGYGEVSVADETHPAAFRVQGIDWRWDFGCDERDAAYPFAFVIEPDGTGLYYNFRPSKDGTAKPSDVFDCVMVP